MFHRVLIPSHPQTRDGGKVQKLKSLFLSPVAFKLEVDNQNKKKKFIQHCRKCISTRTGDFRLLKDDIDYSGSEEGKRGSRPRFGGIRTLKSLIRAVKLEILILCAPVQKSRTYSLAAQSQVGLGGRGAHRNDPQFSAFQARMLTASQVVLVVKNTPANAGEVRDSGSTPGSDGSSGGGNSNPLQYSCLESPMDRRAWQPTLPRITKSQTQLKRLSTQAYSCKGVGGKNI